MRRSRSARLRRVLRVAYAVFFWTMTVLGALGGGLWAWSVLVPPPWHTLETLVTAGAVIFALAVVGWSHHCTAGRRDRRTCRFP